MKCKICNWKGEEENVEIPGFCPNCGSKFGMTKEETEENFRGYVWEQKHVEQLNFNAEFGGHI